MGNELNNSFFMKLPLFISLVFCFPLIALAQTECRSEMYKATLLRQSPALASKVADIESFTQNWLSQKGTSINGAQSGYNGSVLITIPVVVHIVYNTPGQNISDNQINSQIQVLNNDYYRLNADTSNTPDLFKPFAASCDFQFVLANVAPNGMPTTGIIRKQTAINGFNIDDRIKYSIKGGDDAWDAASYLNIWVGNLASGILGYSSVPGCSKEIDGVVVSSSCFGTLGNLMAPFNKGRTTTHEIGHWLNLIHTWGDAICGDDRVDDTPPQKGPNRGCPGEITITCGSGPFGDMYMNYMDFTNDACMNLFTNGQRDRMRSLFAAGGVRNSILSSPAAVASSNSKSDAPIPTKDDGNPGMQIYPNPSVSLVTVQLPDSMDFPVQLSLYNVTGQPVMTFWGYQHIQQINVVALSAGVYYLKAENSKFRKVARMVKM